MRCHFALQTFTGNGVEMVEIVSMTTENNAHFEVSEESFFTHQHSHLARPCLLYDLLALYFTFFRSDCTSFSFFIL